MSIPIALTIAGSDSGGGAGIQADLKTFHAFGCFGTSAVTAVTVQNTLGVTGVHAIPVDVVRAQIAAVASDLPPAACKTGMLATAELVRAVAESIREHALPNYVLDPVMVATSGDRLLDADAARTIVDELLPLASCVTPNLDEAAILVGFTVEDADAMRRAARALVERGAQSALLKGGHQLRPPQVPALEQRGGRSWWTCSSTARSGTSGGAPGCGRAARTAPAAPSPRRSRPAWPTAIPCGRRWRRRWTTCSAPWKPRPAWAPATAR